MHQTNAKPKTDFLTGLIITMGVLWSVVIILGSIGFAVMVGLGFLATGEASLSHILGALFANLGVMVGLSLAVLVGAAR